MAGVNDSIPLDRIAEDIAQRKFAALGDAKSDSTRYSDKVAVVTGATGFIGKEIAARLALKGAEVYICARNKERAEKLISEFESKSLSLKYVLFDLNDEQEISEAFEKIISNSKKIDILVNCAGGSSRDDWNYLYKQSAGVISEVLDTNLKGTILCSKWASKHMADNKSGRIINISSTVGIGGKAGFSEYAAAKAGVIGLTKSLAIEMGEFGVTVNCVTPGIVFRGEMTSAKIDEIASKNVMGSVGVANDIAYAVDFFASDEANFITGQNLIVDGGRSLGLKGD